MDANEKLEREVAALADLSREQLAHLWAKSYDCPPPKGVKRGLLERAAAWHLQARMLGGLSPETRRTLKEAVRQHEQRLEQGRPALLIGGRTQAVDFAAEQPADAPASSAVPEDVAPDIAAVEKRGRTARRRRLSPAASLPAPRIVLSPGARLLREWNGRQHFVEVAENGYVFDGKTYRSLSAVARRITGAHWSGPRFFGI